MADEAGLGKPMVLRRVVEMAKLIVARLPEVTIDNPVSIGVAELIKIRCEETLRRFASN
jgi:hypothetical protein